MSEQGYAKLPSEPPLRPPSQEYVEAYCRTRTPLGGASAPHTARPLKAASADRRGSPQSRLFDTVPGDAADYAGFCSALSEHIELPEMRDAEEQRRRTALLRILGGSVASLALLQTVCAVVFAMATLADPAKGATDLVSLLTCSLIAGSGGLGLVGGVARSQWALQGFFQSQLWALSVVFAQWLRLQQQSGRTSLFCAQHSGDVAEGRCETSLAQAVAIVLSLLAAYASMMVADVFAEKLQDQFEYEDQLSLIRFAWLMHRKTLVGVQRFENLLHHKFDELVDAGVLQARTSPPAKPRAR